MDICSREQHVLDFLSRIERKLDGLQNFSLQIDRIEETLLKLQVSTSSKSGLSQEGQTQVGLPDTFTEEYPVLSASDRIGKNAAESGKVPPPLIRPISILKKKGRDEADQIPLPQDQPQTVAIVPVVPVVPVVPGEVHPREERSVGPQHAKAVASRLERRLSGSSHLSSQGRRGNYANTADSAEAVSVDELTRKTTRKLLRGFSACSASFPLDGLHGNKQQNSLAGGPRGSKQSGREAVLEKTQNIDLDELRTNHNAVVTSMSVRSIAPLDTSGGMPRSAELLLVFAGILELWCPRFWRLWVFCFLVLFLTGTGFLGWWSGIVGVLDADIALTTFCYMAGIVGSIGMLRKGDIQELLTDDESSLDMYARQAGFVKEWRRKSRRRFFEAFGCLVLICSSRCLVHLQLPISAPDLVVTSSFCLASIGLIAVVYLQLHIFSGLELAIDSFSVNFFRDMDFENALAEWNVLQALLRHVSTKLSGSLLMLGFSFGSFILYLIELGFVRTDVPRGFQFVFQNFWSIPPILLFLYTMMRAAAVTEKASRVSPLVNSWSFDNNTSESDEEEEEDWMDLRRQYIVQYINQSEAGFYMQGVRIRIFQVTKMLYYLGAVLFAVVSQMAV